MYQQIINAIKYQIELGRTDFVIYPFGKNGKLAKTILNWEFHIQEKYIVDNKLCLTDSRVKSVDYMRDDYRKNDFIILLAVDFLSPSYVDVHRQISDFAELERIADILSPSTYFNPWNYYGEIIQQKQTKYHITECISREIYRNNIKGAIAEVGVYKGRNAQMVHIYFPDRRLYLFDTFEGFDERDQKSDDDSNYFNAKLDFGDTSPEKVLKKMCFPQNVVIRKGWFPDSANGVEDEYAFVWLDVDLYQPTYAGLNYFYPLMSGGGYIAVHDCRSENFDGAKAAVKDFCREKHLNYMCMPDTLGTAVIPIGFKN